MLLSIHLFVAPFELCFLFGPCFVILYSFAMGLSAVSDCGISRSYSLIFFSVILLRKRESVAL